MARWPQNTARLSRRRIFPTPFELPAFSTTASPDDIFGIISLFPFANDGVQKAKSEMSDYLGDDPQMKTLAWTSYDFCNWC